MRGARIELSGLSVAITGGSRGLGLALARRLVAAGSRVALLARDPARLAAAAAELSAGRDPILALPCDVRERAQVEGALAEVAARHGRIDVLINNAGVIARRQAGAGPGDPAAPFADELAVHFYGPLWAMLAVRPAMLRQGGGRIVNVTAIEGRLGLPQLAATSASKAALSALSDALRAEWAPDGILITTVCPGLMRTGPEQAPRGLGARLARLPGVSIASDRAAARVVRALVRGRPALVLPLSARLAIALEALAPSLFARLAAAAARRLPRPGA